MQRVLERRRRSSMRGEGRDTAETRLNRLLNLITEAAVDQLGYDAATVTARHGDDLITVCATDQRFVALDEAQYASADGPCVAVLERGGHIILGDARSSGADDWDVFRQTAEQLGIMSVLSVAIPTDLEDIKASLNLYAHGAVMVGDQQIAAADGFANQLALAMDGLEAHRATSHLARQTADAMRNRAVIEQAKGMLMAEHGVDDATAFVLLRRQSRQENVRIRDLAARIVATRSSSAQASR
jgi:hypothetical protein